MNKSTVVFLILGAMCLGALIGLSFVESPSADSPRVADSTKDQTPAESAEPAFRFISPGDLEVAFNDFGRAKPSVIGENFIARSTEWKSETLVIDLPLGGEIEYKAIMRQGDSIVFDWRANQGQIYSDFHGHDSAFGDDFFVRYQESESASQSGMIVAAFSGEHGWYWLNMDESPAKITLRVAGFFERIVRLEIEDYQ